jgi:hypothetical protein
MMMRERGMVTSGKVDFLDAVWFIKLIISWIDFLDVSKPIVFLAIANPGVNIVVVFLGVVKPIVFLANAYAGVIIIVTLVILSFVVHFFAFCVAHEILFRNTGILSDSS